MEVPSETARLSPSDSALSLSFFLLFPFKRSVVISAVYTQRYMERDVDPYLYMYLYVNIVGHAGTYIRIMVHTPTCVCTGVFLHIHRQIELDRQTGWRFFLSSLPSCSWHAGRSCTRDLQKAPADRQKFFPLCPNRPLASCPCVSLCLRMHVPSLYLVRTYGNPTFTCICRLTSSTHACPAWRASLSECSEAQPKHPRCPYSRRDG